MLGKVKAAGRRIICLAERALDYIARDWYAVFDAIALIRARREEEVSVSFSGIAGCLMAGIIMAVAKPLVKFITGIDIDKPEIPELPAEVASMMNKLFLLVQYLGVVLVVIGIIWAGISLKRRFKNTKRA